MRFVLKEKILEKRAEITGKKSGTGKKSWNRYPLP
jgi:hypothetical protein